MRCCKLTFLFLVPSNDTLAIGDLVQLKQTMTMVLWPKGPKTNLTPSPYMDELKHKLNKIKLQAAELNEARSKLNMHELLEEVKPGPLTKQLGKTRNLGGEYIEILLYHVYKLLRPRIHPGP